MKSLAVSQGTASRLGLLSVKQDVLPATAYFMLGERCIYNCAFCARGKNPADAGGKRLSRVPWPEYSPEEIKKGLEGNPGFSRICLQVLEEKDTSLKIAEALKFLKQNTALPICVASLPRDKKDVKELFKAGADRVCIGLDAATVHVAAKSGKPFWQRSLNILLESLRDFPGRMTTHLIAGLGETEEEMILLINELVGAGVTVALFAFTPLPGTPMAGEKEPELGAYRRVQAAHYLLKEKAISVGDLRFSHGRLKAIGGPFHAWRERLKNGKAFMTSGCPGCNRPYYNERPGRKPYNYARPLTEEEVRECIDGLELEENHDKHI